MRLAQLAQRAPQPQPLVDVGDDDDALHLGRDRGQVDLDLLGVRPEDPAELGHGQVRLGQLVEEHQVLGGQHPAAGVAQQGRDDEVVVEDRLVRAEGHPQHDAGEAGISRVSATFAPRVMGRAITGPSQVEVGAGELGAQEAALGHEGVDVLVPGGRERRGRGRVQHVELREQRLRSGCAPTRPGASRAGPGRPRGSRAASSAGSR